MSRAWRAAGACGLLGAATASAFQSKAEARTSRCAQPTCALVTSSPSALASVRRALSNSEITRHFVLKPVPLAGQVAGTAQPADAMLEGPQTLEEAMRKARADADQALRSSPEASYGMGLGGGVIDLNGRLFEVSCCAICDGKTTRVGFGSVWETGADSGLRDATGDLVATARPRGDSTLNEVFAPGDAPGESSRHQAFTECSVSMAAQDLLEG